MRSVLFLLPALLLGCDGGTDLPGDAQGCPVDISGAEVVTGPVTTMDAGTYLVCGGGSLTANVGGQTIVLDGGSATTNGGGNDVWIAGGSYTGNGGDDMIYDAGGSIVTNGTGDTIEACTSIDYSGAACP